MTDLEKLARAFRGAADAAKPWWMQASVYTQNTAQYANSLQALPPNHAEQDFVHRVLDNIARGYEAAEKLGG